MIFPTIPSFTKLELWLAGVLVIVLAILGFGAWERHVGARACRAEVKAARDVAIKANKIATEMGQLADSKVDKDYAAKLAEPVTVLPRIYIPVRMRTEPAATVSATAKDGSAECTSADLRNANTASDLQSRLDTLVGTVVHVGRDADAEVIMWRAKLAVAEDVCASRAT